MSARRALSVLPALAAGLLHTAPAEGQDPVGKGSPVEVDVRSISPSGLERRVARIPGPVVVFHFAARAGVEGCGADSVSWSRGSVVFGAGAAGARDDCREGPVEVRLERGESGFDRVKVRVGVPTEASAGNLGRVPAPEAAAFLLHLASAAVGGAGSEAIFPVLLADSVVAWPGILALANDREVEERVRKQAIFWLGQEAAEALTAELVQITTDEADADGVRRAALFALSQRPAAESVPALMEIATTSREPKLLRDALFWLAQADDPRVPAFFERILVGERR